MSWIDRVAGAVVETIKRNKRLSPATRKHMIAGVEQLQGTLTELPNARGRAVGHAADLIRQVNPEVTGPKSETMAKRLVGALMRIERGRWEEALTIVENELAKEAVIDYELIRRIREARIEVEARETR